MRFSLSYLMVGALLCGAPIVLAVSSSAIAHDPGSYESPIVEKRVKRSKQCGDDIQSVFKKQGDSEVLQAA